MKKQKPNIKSYLPKKKSKRTLVYHGESRKNKKTGKQELTKLYSLWHHLLDGGRCQEWQNYLVFKKWALENGFNEETGMIHFRKLTSQKPFSPDNTLITTAFSPNATYLTLNGMTMNMNQWAKYLGMSRQMLQARLAHGYTVQEALLMPKGADRNKVDMKADEKEREVWL